MKGSTKEMFKTLEEANDYKLEMETKYNDLKQAKEGLETKLQESTSTIETHSQEINRLKIKNYEYFEQLSLQQNDNTIGEGTPESKVEPPSLDVIIKDFR